jgi:hypothetical protein
MPNNFHCGVMQIAEPHSKSFKFPFMNHRRGERKKREKFLIKNAAALDGTTEIEIN